MIAHGRGSDLRFERVDEKLGGRRAGGASILPPFSYIAPIMTNRKPAVLSGIHLFQFRFGATQLTIPRDSTTRKPLGAQHTTIASAPRRIPEPFTGCEDGELTQRGGFVEWPGRAKSQLPIHRHV